MNIRFAKLAAAAIVCLAAAIPQSCRTRAESEAAGPRLDRGAAVASYSAFGIDLYLKTAAADAGKNVFISPASVGFALAMTWNGSAGETREAMARTLRLPTTDPGAVNAADSALIAGMKAPIENVELAVANSLWGRQGVDFKKPFLERNKRSYGAELRSLDFANPESPGVINAWVAGNTKGKIRDIVDRIDPAAVLFLINAIYFKGAWETEFDESLTAEEVFHGAGGDVRAPMMKQSGKYSYLAGDGFQAARLPYGDGRIGMYVFLPDEASNLAEFHAKLSAETWKGWMEGFTKRDGRIALPRFTIEYKAKLRRALSELGMGIAFDGAAADFSGMLSVPGVNAYIHDVIHKTFCEVNEKGTEAAAVTSVEIRVTSVMEPPKRFEMVCDRPFFFAIVDGETGLILFMGSLANPS
jgi:serpin B